MPKDQQYAITVTDDGLTIAEATADDAALFTIVPADVNALTDGKLDLNVAFMQGRVKAAGDMRGVLAVLRAAAGPA